MLGAAALFAATTACDDNNIGNSILETDMSLVVDSSFTISGESVATSKIQARTVTKLLGKLHTSEYGTLSSDFVTEFMPSSVIDTTNVTADNIDSLKLVMTVPFENIVGDTLAPMRVNVYRLNKRLPYPIYSDFNPSEYYSESDLLGSTSYTMSNSIYTKDYYNNVYHYCIVEVDLPKQLGKDLFTLYKQSPSTFSDPELFADAFKGIYATTSYGSGSVIPIESTYLNLFYSKHEKTDEGNDTIMKYSGQYFAVSPEIVTNNNIQSTSSDAIKQRVAQGEVVVQSPVGYEAKITFPTQALLDTYYGHQNQGITVLSSLSLKIPVIEIANDKNITPPKYLLMVRASEKDDFFANSKIVDNTNSFYATYDSSTKTYTFSSMRTFLKGFISDNKTQVTADDEEFVLVPVDITTETSNSYYEQKEVITSVTPQVSTLSMAVLDIKNAKVIAAFSKKSVNK